MPEPLNSTDDLITILSRMGDNLIETCEGDRDKIKVAVGVLIALVAERDELRAKARNPYGPQTAAVLAELVELLTNTNLYSDDSEGEFITVVSVKDRKAFLKEQGVL